MAAGLFYSTVFGLAALVFADPFYGQNNIKGGHTPQADCTTELQGPNYDLKRAVSRYERDKYWPALKLELIRVLNASSPAYRQASNISDAVTYPLEQMSSTTDNIDLLNTLLDSELAPDIVAGRDNWTMLHFTAEHGITPVAELLLSRRADPNARTSTQDTPVIIAAWRNHLPVVKVLNQHGADLNSQNEDGRTALHRASYWGNADVVKYLVDSCANTTITTKLGNSPVDDARNRGYPAIVEMLSRQRSDC